MAASTASNGNACTFPGNFEAKTGHAILSGFVLNDLPGNPDKATQMGNLKSDIGGVRLGASTPLMAVTGKAKDGSRVRHNFRRGAADESKLQELIGSRAKYLAKCTKMGMSKDDADREYNEAVLAISTVAVLSTETEIKNGSGKVTLVHRGLVNFIAQEPLPAGCSARWTLDTEAERRARVAASSSGTTVISGAARYIAENAAPVLRPITPKDTVTMIESAKRACVVRRKNATAVAGAAPGRRIGGSSKGPDATSSLAGNVMDTSVMDFLVKMALFLESAGLTVSTSAAAVPLDADDVFTAAGRTAFFRAGVPDEVATAKMFPLGALRGAMKSTDVTGARTRDEASPMHAMANIATALGLTGATPTLPASVLAEVYRIAEGVDTDMTSSFASELGTIRTLEGSVFAVLPESNNARAKSAEWAASRFKQIGPNAVTTKKENDVQTLMVATRPAAKSFSNTDTKAGESVCMYFTA